MRSTDLKFSRFAGGLKPVVLAGMFCITLQLCGLLVVPAPDAFAVSAKEPAQNSVPLAQPAAPAVGVKGTVYDAVAAYDKAFQGRDLEALKQIFAEDVLMYEQGGQDVGREQVLKHLGPELQSFQELEGNYSNLRIRETGKLAIVTRQFYMKAKRQGRYQAFYGSETQGWVFEGDRWQLAHVHISFPGR